MEELKELKQLITRKQKEQVPIQTKWVKVKAVDWENKTMTGQGLDDDLDYDDVLLGLGALYRKPKVGVMATIGLINNSAAAYLIDCEETQEVEWQNEGSSYVINKNGFQIKRNDESLKDVLNDFIDEVNKIVVIQGTTINQAEVLAIKQRLNTILN